MAQVDDPITTRADGRRYRVDWQPVAPAAAAAPDGWLLVLPERAEDWAWRWAEALATPGTRMLRVAENATCAALAAELRATDLHAPGSGVISLLAAGPSPALDSLVLLQALGEAEIGAPLWALTCGAVSTGAQDPVRRPDAAQVWGLGFVAGLEHPDRWGGLIDVPEDAGPDRAARVWSLAASGPGGEDQVAVRPEGVYGRRVGPAPALAGDCEPWRPRGAALVVGGTGALGSLVAEWLAANGCEQVVIAARGAADAGLGARLAELGAKSVFRSCDVSDRAAVAALAADLRAEGIRIRAVFHCAGVAQSIGLAELTPQAFGEGTAAKTLGAANLDAEFGADLDAFVLFGCFPGVWGSYGRAAAAAADAGLDAIARRRQAAGRPTTAISWGAWAAGGTLTVPMVVEQLRRGGVTPLPPQAALAAMAALAGAGRSSELVIDIDWATFAAVFTARRPSPLIAGLAAVSGLGRRIADLPAAERAAASSDLLRIETAAVFGLSRPDLVAMDRPLADLGGEELVGVLAERLRRALGHPPPPFTGSATPAEVARALTAAGTDL